MALERVPADIRAEGGVARMADTTIIEEVVKGCKGHCRDNCIFETKD